MKKLYILISLSLSFSLVKADYWTQKADFGGTPRNYAAAFSIGNKGYVGTGWDSISSITNDFWEYDPMTNTWTQKANFAGPSRCYATGFSIGNKGYIVSGGNVYLGENDFWEYDPSLNIWTQKNNALGLGRLCAVSFSIGNKGYFGTGIADLFNMTYFHSDFWQYDPATDTWSQKASVLSAGLASAYYGAAGFSIGTKGYLGTGVWNPAMLFADCFFEYDPVVNVWTQKANYGGGAVYGAVGFSIGSKGYFGTGTGFQNDFWEYDPS